MNKRSKNVLEVDVIICAGGGRKKKLYSISAVQFPNIVTQGKTVEEAKRRLREALKLYFEDFSEEKKESLIFCKREAPMISRIFL